MTEKEYIVAGDLAKLRIARAAIADTMPEHWPSHGLPAIGKVDAIDNLNVLISAAESAVSAITMDGGA